MKLTFVHPLSLLNLRGSEYWLMDAASLLKDSMFTVQVVNFDFARRYPKSPVEILRRKQIVREGFKGIPVVRLRALSLRWPRGGSWVGNTLNEFAETYLHFLPSPRFLRFLRDSDAIYFVQGQRSTAYLIVVLACSFIAGRRPVVAGIHVQPKISSFDLALLRIFVKLGVLRGIHEINRSHESELKKIGCRVEYIPNGIHSEKFDSIDQKKVSGENFTILFVGAMTKIKGADMLPDIYNALKKQGMEFTLVICTSGGELLEQVKSWSENKTDVVFKGLVDRSELINLYGKSSVVLFPSKREAFPLACLEAQASGTPVVVSNIEGFRQAVLNDRTGFLVPSHVAVSFAETIHRVYTLWKDDKSRYSEICRAAKENVKKNFQWKRMVSAFTRFFEEIVK